jgi:hypothetical protein
VAVTILDFKMTSNRSRHTARIVPGTQYTWEVSWLPGRDLERNEAITAMVIADTTAYGDVHPGHPSWPHIENWAAELGMTGPQALDRTAAPPQWASRQTAKTAGLPAEYRLFGFIEDPDPIDLGWTDEPDWPAPDYPDPSWPGRGAGPRERRTYLSDPAVSDWHQDRHPANPATTWDALHADPDRQPAPERDKSADWEAGQ